MHHHPAFAPQPTTRDLATLEDEITTHYSAPELEELIEAANRVCEGKSGKAPALVVLKHRRVNA